MSVGQKQFSLNGGYRSPGWVGQNSLNRSLSVVPVNDPKVMKPSVIGTMGMIDTRFRWINRPQPYSVFKVGVADTSSYIDILRTRVLQTTQSVSSPKMATDGVCNTTKDVLKPKTIQERYSTCQDTKPRMTNVLSIPVVGGIHS